MIRIQHLGVHYDQKQVLQDFSLELPDQGVVTLFGPSGCGKTTLLDALCGFVPLDTGSIQWAEKAAEKIQGLSDRPSPPSISRVFQDNRFLPWCDVATNVSCVIPQEADQSQAKAMEALRLVGLEQEAHRYPDELSGGMQKRLGLARAWAFDGALILLDEPTVGIDQESAYEILDRLMKHWADRLVLLITHDLPLAERYSQTIYHVTGIPLSLIKTPASECCRG